MARFNGLTMNLAAVAVVAFSACAPKDPCAEDPTAEGCPPVLTDTDGDGYFSDVDCDDANAAINPGATDVPDNGIDEDCAGGDEVSPPPAFFEPYAFFLNGAFGFDPDSGTARTWLVPDGSGGTVERKPYLDFTIVEQDWFNTSGDARYECHVILEFEGAGVALTPYDFTDQYKSSSGSTLSAPVSHDALVWTKAMMSGAVAQTDCTAEEEKQFDPDVWGDDAVAVVTQWSFGVGFGTERPDIKTWLDSAAPAENRDQYFGGGTSWERLAESGGTAYSAGSYGYALALDDDFNVIVDGEGNGTPLKAVDALAGAKAIYIVNAYWGWNAQGLLP